MPEPEIIYSVKGIHVYDNGDGSYSWTADAAVDGDGAPNCYHPLHNSLALDNLANAGHPGNWWGVATQPNGQPYIQTAEDPCPGFCVSTTSYEDTAFAVHDPKRYLDARVVPFLVLTKKMRELLKGIVLGCKAEISFNGKTVEAMVGDIGPLPAELSVAAAKALGINPSCKTGGTEQKSVKYTIWPDKEAVINGKTYKLIPA